MNQAARRYLAAIGRTGGIRSRRTLTPAQARDMVRVREARKAYKRYFAECFWSSDPARRITADDVPWVADQLRKHGDDAAWMLAARLCR